jgi:hypothetical protein
MRTFKWLFSKIDCKMQHL